MLSEKIIRGFFGIPGLLLLSEGFWAVPAGIRTAERKIMEILFDLL